MWWRRLDDEQREAVTVRVTGEWENWYESAIPAADDLYDAYLTELRDEGLI